MTTLADANGQNANDSSIYAPWISCYCEVGRMMMIDDDDEDMMMRMKVS